MIPQLYVFAGPNGAGKSSFSALMLGPGIPVFDGDKELAKLKRTFDSTDSGTFDDAVKGHIFDEWKQSHLSTKADCAFETNFRSAQVMNTIRQFADYGYETNMYFFGLDSIQAAIERVRLRVAEGGHDVSLENIKANYDEGLKNLSAYFTGFDRVILLQNFAGIDEPALFTPLMQIEKGQIVEQAADQPGWVAHFLATAFQN
jgi:predicted ABC-type ATPase